LLFIYIFAMDLRVEPVASNRNTRLFLYGELSI